jgi:hypothetical protein
MRWLAAFPVVLVLVGCKEVTAQADKPSPGARLTVNEKGLTLKADDGQGSRADIQVDSRHLGIEGQQEGLFDLKLDSEKGELSVRARSSDGSFESNVPMSETDVGMPFYPGSEELPNLNMRAKTPTEQTAIAFRSTADSPQQVAEFYRRRLPGSSEVLTRNENGEKVVLQATASSGVELTVMAERKNGETRTSIGLIRVVKSPRLSP